jgi:hypothetical protein
MRSIHARTACALLAALAVALLGAPPAVAAPPANDDFDNAAAIVALPFEATQDTSEATRAADDPECIDGDGHTVWYSFAPSADVDVVLDTFGSVWGAGTRIRILTRDSVPSADAVPLLVAGSRACPPACPLSH